MLSNMFVNNKYWFLEHSQFLKGSVQEMHNT